MFQGNRYSDTVLIVIVVVVASAFIFGLVVVPVVSYMFIWWKRRLRQKRKQKATTLLKARLMKNWSALLSSDYVNDLSYMPEEWKSGIVPCRSKAGQNLKSDLQKIAKQIKTVSTRRWCCGSRTEEERKLKISMEYVMQEKVAGFFAARDEMYKLYLLEDAKLKGKNTQSSATTKAKGPASKSMSVESNAKGTTASLQPNRDLESWPENTTPLFQQIMFLLRDLDDMFRASYNQRFNLRIMDNEMQEWTDWTQNEFPKMMPEEVVLKQNIADVYDLYQQAAQVHSHYNNVFASVAKATKALWIPAPLKQIFRILEKAGHEHKGDRVIFDCSKIFDIVRGTLVYDTLAEGDGGLLRGVCAVFASKNFQVARLKDRFTNPTSACWRDVLLNGRMISSLGTVQPHLVEVQFHQRDLRAELMNAGGHLIYERHRALFKACETACGSEAAVKLHELRSASAASDRKLRELRVKPFASNDVRSRKVAPSPDDK